MSYQEQGPNGGYVQQGGPDFQAETCAGSQGSAGANNAGYPGQGPVPEHSCGCGQPSGSPGNGGGQVNPAGAAFMNPGPHQAGPAPQGPGLNNHSSQGCGQETQAGPGTVHGYPHTPPYSQVQHPPYGAYYGPPHPQMNAPMHGAPHPGYFSHGHHGSTHAHPPHHLQGAAGYGPGPGSSPGHGPGVQNHHGELYQIIQQAANGQPDVSRFLNFFNNVGSDFWKGALVGAGITLLMTSDSVKNMLAGGIGGLWGMMGAGAEEMEAREDLKAEAKQAGEEKK